MEVVHQAPGLTLRPAAPAEAELVAELMTADDPDEPKDVVQLRQKWANPRPGWTWEYFIAELDGRPAGIASNIHAGWAADAEVRDAWVHAMLRGGPEADALAAMESRAIADGADVLLSSCRENDAARIGLLEGRGYERTSLAKAWELDLVAGRERLLALAETTRAQMREQGIQLLTVTADPDPDRLRKLHALHVSTGRDMPHDFPQHDVPFEYYAERALQSQTEPLGRRWVAKDGDRYVGLSLLSFPVSRGHVWTWFTGVDRDYRGRGIARAVKMETLAQAIELGVKNVRTDNDARNGPMLHINEKLGYERIPGWFDLAKRLRA